MNQLYLWGTQLPAAGFYAFIFLWLFIESTGFPISDEPLLLLSGYLTTTGRLTLALVIALALTGKTAASCLAYWAGMRLDLERLARPAHAPQGWRRALWALRPTPAVARIVKERFQRQGAWGVFLGRLVPIVRSFISYPAGAARMPFARFLLATAAGSLLWISLWTLLGAALGRSYLAAQARWASLSWVALAAIVGGSALWLWLQRRHRRRAKMRPRVSPLATSAAERDLL